MYSVGNVRLIRGRSRREEEKVKTEGEVSSTTSLFDGLLLLKEIIPLRDIYRDWSGYQHAFRQIASGIGRVLNDFLRVHALLLM